MIKESGIVELISLKYGEVKVRDIKDKARVWHIPIEGFLKTANLYTDICGNPFYGKPKKEWWQFWK
jgi:hypothetical protein